MKFQNALIYVLCCLSAGIARAEFSDVPQNGDEDIVPVSGEACEKIAATEEKSTVRVRVIDKASFLAVSNVQDVRSLHGELDEHDFNVLVYNLVDNAVEDLSIRTLKQNPAEICVEVKGYLRLVSIFEAVTEQAQNRQKDSENLKETMTDIVNNVNTSYSEIKTAKVDVIQPTDDAELQKHIAPESDGYISVTNTPGAEVRPQVAPETAPKVTAELTDGRNPPALKNENFAIIDDKLGLVYIEPTEFFDSSKSLFHAKPIKDLFAADENFYLTDNKDLADYIIKTKVLRAKVDPVNASTNRLQMVVSVEAEFPEDKSSISEHSNRFVLFSHDENEQEVALQLMKKLFRTAGEKIKHKVEQAERKRRPDKALPDIITPTVSKQPA